MILPYKILVEVKPPASEKAFFLMDKEVTALQGKPQAILHMNDYASWKSKLKAGKIGYSGFRNTITYENATTFTYEFTDFNNAKKFDKKWGESLTEERKAAKKAVKPPRSRHIIGKLPYAYKWGNNPACEESSFHCHDCDLQVFGEDVRFIAYGRNCANGEHSPCPACGEENYVHRAVKEDD